MKNETKPSMMTIKQIAKTGLMSENALRQLLKEGKLPVVYIGKKLSSTILSCVSFSIGSVTPNDRYKI